MLVGDRMVVSGVPWRIIAGYSPVAVLASRKTTGGDAVQFTRCTAVTATELSGPGAATVRPCCGRSGGPGGPYNTENL